MLESEIQKNTNQQHQGGGSSGGGVQHSIPDDLMVRSEDFFSAIHAIMSIKQNRHRIEGKNLKVNNVCSFWLLASCLKDLVTRSLYN